MLNIQIDTKSQCLCMVIRYPRVTLFGTPCTIPRALRVGGEEKGLPLSEMGHLCCLLLSQDPP